MQDRRSDPRLERRLDSWAASQSSVSVSPELQQKLRESLRPSLEPVKPIASRTNLVLIFLAVFLAGAAGASAMMSKTGLHLMTGTQIGVWHGDAALLLIGLGAAAGNLRRAW
jgi:hypothetical protein